MSKTFLIEKNGWYYNPLSRGYTGLKRSAGRFNLDDAALHAGPNGPDGSADGIIIWEEESAPQFSTNCCPVTRVTELTREEALRDAHSAVRAFRERDIHSEADPFSRGVSHGYGQAEQAILDLLKQYEQ